MTLKISSTAEGTDLLGLKHNTIVLHFFLEVTEYNGKGHK